MSSSDGRVISQFIRQSLNGDSLTIYGDGEQTRSFCFIDDTVDGIIKLMESDYNLPINLGSQKEITINKKVNAESVRP